MADGFVRRAEVDAGRFERLVADLALHDWQRQLVAVHIVHDVAVPQGVDGQFMKHAAAGIPAILPADAGSADISHEELTEAVFGVAVARPTGRVEQILGRAPDR